MKTLLVLLLLLGPALAKAQELPTGRLGFPVGTYLRIEGVRVEGIKTGERTLLVDTVNGKKLDKSIEVAVENVESLPKGGRCILRGYETGRMIGTPPALEQAAKEEGRDIPLPQAGWEFRRHFVVISVVEPKNLVLTNTGSGENTTPATAQAIVAGLVAELGALASNHAELAGFPEYVKRLESDQAVEFKTNVMPLALTFQKSVSPVLTKRHIRPSDCGTNGIFFQFVLDDGTNPLQAPADTVTHLPNLKLILYAYLVLWEKASPELRKELAGIMARHKGMLIELDKKAVNKPDAGDGGRAKEEIRATLEADAKRPGWFVIHVTNASSNTVRFLDVREGSGSCGDFYDIMIEKDGTKHESKGNCLYSPAADPFVVTLAAGKTYRREIQPRAYVRSEKHIAAPCRLSVTYRVADKIREMWKAKGEEADLEFTFQTDKATME